MKEPPTIDHDPNERRVTKGETIFVTIVTFVVLTALGYGLKWTTTNYGLGGLAVAIVVEAAIIFPIAFWLEAKKKRSRD